ncbi:hypothetical protein DNHGIG_29160 [Collibacillus ludicampi]|jgi:hypothetical protein|uniref:Uncharacterized protein n=1 Tax=Collibacillus ludicampi TaxID=2771369 RepID=A0AAV4LIY2_9BACL|nr:hypothetical protein [Collibacillus ludicampi]GIM47367.1 hypothetical protein DNHGIG_29160 [Collibacillus ludicampi]
MTFIIIFIVVGLLAGAILIPLNVYLLRNSKENPEETQPKKMTQETDFLLKDQSPSSNRFTPPSVSESRDIGYEDVPRQTDEEYREALRRGLYPRAHSIKATVGKYKDEQYRSALRSMYKQEKKTNDSDQG